MAQDAPDAVDWSGARHAPAGSGARIACLVPSITELLFALELGTQVVARTGFCVHPRLVVRRVPKIGGTKDPDLVRLRAAAPTHVVVNVDENRRDVVEAIARFVPHVIVTHPQEPDDNPRLYRLLGGVFGRAQLAAALCAQYHAARADLDRTVAPLPRERVLYLIWRRPWMTVRPDTYVAATLRAAGWDTLPASAAQRYPEVAEDAPEWREAGRLLLSTEPYAFTRRDVAALARVHPRPVHLVNGEWTSWYGPRAIEGLRSLAALRVALTAERAPPP